MLEFIDPVSRENRMRVRVDESRQDHASAGIDDLRVARHLLFDFIRRTRGDDRAITHQHSAVRNDR